MALRPTKGIATPFTALADVVTSEVMADQGTMINFAQLDAHNFYLAIPSSGWRGESRLDLAMSCLMDGWPGGRDCANEWFQVRSLGNDCGAEAVLFQRLLHNRTDGRHAGTR